MGPDDNPIAETVIALFGCLSGTRFGTLWTSGSVQLPGF